MNGWIFTGEILIGLRYFTGVKAIENLVGDYLSLLLLLINLRSSFFNLTKEFSKEIYFNIVGMFGAPYYKCSIWPIILEKTSSDDNPKEHDLPNYGL